MNSAPVTVNDYLEVDENQTIEFFPLDNDTDPDGDKLRIIDVYYPFANDSYYSISADGGIEFTAEKFNFSPEYEFVSYVVTDDNGGTSVGSVKIKINEINDAPTIGFYGDFIEENTNYGSNIYAFDEEDGFAVTVELSGPDAGAFTQPGTSGHYYFIASPDFENPADANGDNIYELTATVTDSEGLTATQSATVTVFDAPEWVITEGDDTVIGTNFHDYVNLLGGNDLFVGKAGFDDAFGGAGNDTLKGGADGDFLYGDGGNDQINGGSGDDYLYGGADQDTIYGGSGIDDVYGDAGNDNIFGGIDRDYLYGGFGNDSIYGEDGVDYIHGDEGDDQMFGGADDDDLNGDIGDDSLYGESGWDYLDGGSGSDLILGGADNDTLNGGGDNDVLLGGAGNDYHYGGAGNDVMRGDKGDDEFYGEEGNDKLAGGKGNDYLDGGAGNDRLDAGGGANYIVTGSGADTVIIGHYDGAVTENDDLDFSEDTLVIRAFDGNARVEVTSLEQLNMLELDGLTVTDDGFSTYLDFELDNGTSHSFILNGISLSDDFAIA